MFGLVSRRRYNADLNAAKAEIQRLRTERDYAVAEAEDFRASAIAAARQFSGADAANRRLHGRLVELGRRLSACAEADPEYAASLERRVDRLKRVGVRILAAYKAEKRRADRLQRRLDDAVGLTPGRIEDSRRWPPGAQRP